MAISLLLNCQIAKKRIAGMSDMKRKTIEEVEFKESICQLAYPARAQAGTNNS